MLLQEIFYDDEDDRHARWVKLMNAEKRNDRNITRVPQATINLAEKLAPIISAAYFGKRPYINYNLKTVSIKIAGVSPSDKLSKEVGTLNNQLEVDYGLVPKYEGSSAIYHIPYQPIRT